MVRDDAEMASGLVFICLCGKRGQIMKEATKEAIREAIREATEKATEKTTEKATEKAAGEAGMTRRKVVIDCDPGIDDSLALMLAVSMEELDIRGITIVCGNCPVEMGFENAKKVLKFMNRLDIPVFCGAERPLVREYADALDTHGADGMGENSLPQVPGYEQEQTAAEFLISQAREGGCSVIAIGPMTNLAQMLSEDREAFGMLEEIVSMGGNFRSHGNCSPVAEYNYWEDPDAAAAVYEAAADMRKRIVMVGLDVTRRIVLTPDLLEYLKRLSPETGAFVQQITRFYFDFHWQQEHLIGCVINDPLAVAYFADRTLCRGIEAYTQVDTAGIGIGQSIVDSMGFYRKEANALVLTETDPLRFFRLFFSRILGIGEERLDLLESLLGKEAAE